MGTELKADSWHRYVLYKRDDYMRATVGDEAAKRTAIDAGRKFTLAAYADVWAKTLRLSGACAGFLATIFTGMIGWPDPAQILKSCKCCSAWSEAMSAPSW